MTQTDVAAALGVAQSAVSGWERDATEVGASTLRTILTVLGVPESEWAEILRLPRTLDEEAA